MARDDDWAATQKMRGTWMLVLGLVLLVVGIGGLAIVGLGALAPPGSAVVTVPLPAPGLGSVPATPLADTIGAAVYLTGVGSNGPVPRSGGPIWFRRMGGGCAFCHGASGQGGSVSMMMGGTLEVPDIRYSTLTSPQPSDTGTGTTPAWTNAQIEAAIRRGVGPDGKSLDPAMPRWGLTASDMTSLLDYLKGLSAR